MNDEESFKEMHRLYDALPETLTKEVVVNALTEWGLGTNAMVSFLEELTRQLGR